MRHLKVWANVGGEDSYRDLFIPEEKTDEEVDYLVWKVAKNMLDYGCWEIEKETIEEVAE